TSFARIPNHTWYFPVRPYNADPGRHRRVHTACCRAAGSVEAASWFVVASGGADQYHGGQRLEQEMLDEGAPHDNSLPRNEPVSRRRDRVAGLPPPARRVSAPDARAGPGGPLSDRRRATSLHGGASDVPGPRCRNSPGGLP